MSFVATAIIGSAVVGAGASIFSSGKAVDAQKNATNQAAATQMDMYYRTRGDLTPYRHIGEIAQQDLERRLPELTAPIDVSAELANPNSVARKAYDFTLTQGNKVVSNAAAARGLGVSGAALKGATNFTTGLADNTYKTVFDIANTNQTNAYNRLKGLVDTGNNAAAGTGAAGTAAASGAASSLTAGGNAQAAGYNAMGGAIGNAANSIGGYAAYKGLYGGGSGGPISDYSSPNNAIFTGNKGTFNEPGFA